jgi:hypothetical protein
MSDFLVLHALAVKGFATSAAVARFGGIDEVGAAASLDRLGAGGLATFRGGRVDAWALTPDGREQHRRLLDAERAERGEAAGPHHTHRRFVALNDDCKQLCTVWQRQGRSADLVDRLRELHVAVLAALGLGVDAVPRFAAYRSRLTDAVDRVVAGDDSALARPLTESFHDIWMELHEDLLQTLGLDRSVADGA